MKMMTNKELEKNLTNKIRSLSYAISNGNEEVLLMMDEWYDTIKLLDTFSEHKPLVALSGNDLPLIVEYIDDKCILLVPEEYLKNASKGMQ
tara:strand:+ start:97 stop:369 length:273 start_codon:yes stop_codon:yes gene_type:complete